MTLNTNVLVNAPVASVSGRLALSRPSGRPCDDQPSEAGVRPWGLRRMGPVMHSAGKFASVRYDDNRQLAVDAAGVALIDRTPVMAKPTANTTSTVDGEDPPSSEDWNNDFHGDEPYQP